MTRLVLAALALFVPLGASAEEPAVLKIGIPKSAFRDLPPALLSFAGEPLRGVLKEQTGLAGEAIIKENFLEIARDLNEGGLQVGVFLGHEFAWARAKYPSLEPLVRVVPRPEEIRAVMLVRWDRKATGLGDLKGSKLVLARNTRDHVLLYLERKKADDMEGDFCATDAADSVTDATFKVIQGEAAVTVVDAAAWSYFQKLYPGASQNLKELGRSDVFPPTVVACKKGSLSDSTRKSLFDGLRPAHRTPKAARLMRLIRIDRFDDIPASFEAALRECRMTYPRPLDEK